MVNQCKSSYSFYISGKNMASIAMLNHQMVTRKRLRRIKKSFAA